MTPLALELGISHLLVGSDPAGGQRGAISR